MKSLKVGRSAFFVAAIVVFGGIVALSCQLLNTAPSEPTPTLFIIPTLVPQATEISEVQAVNEPPLALIETANQEVNSFKFLISGSAQAESPSSETLEITGTGQIEKGDPSRIYLWLTVPGGHSISEVFLTNEGVALRDAETNEWKVTSTPENRAFALRFVNLALLPSRINSEDSISTNIDFSQASLSTWDYDGVAQLDDGKAVYSFSHTALDIAAWQRILTRVFPETVLDGGTIATTLEFDQDTHLLSRAHYSVSLDSALLSGIAIELDIIPYEFNSPLDLAAIPAEVVKPPPPNAQLNSVGYYQVADEYGVEMVLVPAGDFTMGGQIPGIAEQGGQNDALPAHLVTLSKSYWIDVYEATNAQYQECVIDSVCQPPEFTNSNTHSAYYGNPEFNSYPVIALSWFDADTYCKWRNGRLPTEAEWEYAARGADGRSYTWGNEPLSCNLLNYFECYDDAISQGDTKPITDYSAGISPFGLYNMLGNEKEWVADWYGPYPAGHVIDPTGPASGVYRITRGGSYFSGGIVEDGYDLNYRLHAAMREAWLPGAQAVRFGVRCVRDELPGFTP